MSGNGSTAVENPVRLRPAENSRRASENVWGGAVVEPGNCIVSSQLPGAQDRLRLSPTRVAVPMWLCDLFFERGRKPCPRKAVLVERLGLNALRVQRKIADLEMPGSRQARRASGRAWGKSDQHPRPRLAGGAAEEARTGIPRGAQSRQDGPQGGLQAGRSPKPNRRCGETVMSGSGMQTGTPGAYRVAEAGPGCTQ